MATPEELADAVQTIKDLNVGLQSLQEFLASGAPDLSDLDPAMRSALFDASAQMVSKAKHLQALNLPGFDAEISTLVNALQQIQMKFAPPSLLKSAVYGASTGATAADLVALAQPPMKKLADFAAGADFGSSSAGPFQKFKAPSGSLSPRAFNIFAKPPQDSASLKPKGQTINLPGDTVAPATPPFVTPDTRDCSIVVIAMRGGAGNAIRVCDLPPGAREPLSGPPVVAPSPSALPWVVAVLAAGGLGFYMKNRKTKKAST